MKFIFSFFLSVFISFSSIGQTFSLQELIKLSKMNTDSFDTYVTSKGFVFKDSKKEDDLEKFTYALNLNLTNLKASKFISLLKNFMILDIKFPLQTYDKNEYVKIKNQIKTLGFKLIDTAIFTSDDGEVSNRFEYSNGKSIISIYASSISFEVNFGVKF